MATAVIGARPARTGGMAMASLRVSGAAMLARAAALLLQVVIARQFGRSAVIDSFSVALTVSVFVGGLLTSSIQSLVVPSIVRLREAGGEDAHRFADSLFTLFVLANVAVTLLLEAGTDILVRLVAPGFPPAQAAQTALLIRLLAISTLGSAVAGYCSGVANAVKSFMLPALVQAILPLAALALLLGRGSGAGVELLAVGYIAGACLLAPIQLRHLRRLGFRLRLNLRIHPETWSTVAKIGPVALGAFCAGLVPVVDRSFAASLPAGSVATIEYASKLLAIPQQIIASGLLAVLLTGWAGAYARDGEAALRRSVRQAVQVVVALVAPAVVIGGVVAPDLIQIAFQRGQFDGAATAAVAGYFRAALPGFLLETLVLMYLRVPLVRGEPRLLLYVGVANLGLRAGCDAVLVRWLGVQGIALSYSASSALLLVGVHWRLFGLPRPAAWPRVGRWYGRCASALVVALLATLDAASLARGGPPWLAAAVGGCAGALTYLGAAHLLRIEGAFALPRRGRSPAQQLSPSSVAKLQG